MAIIKCKMCGGDMELTAETSVAECEYCGSKQTVPKADDEKKLTPCLVPYNELPEAEKEYDRITALETLKTIIKLGYRIEKDR